MSDIKDVKTPEELEEYVSKVVFDIVGKFCHEQIARFPNHLTSDVVLAVHEGAVTGALGSLLRGADVPTEVAGQMIVATHKAARAIVRAYTS
jgi:hypothetical protein